MKKKLLTLLLVCAMALSFSLVAFAGDDVSGRDAVTADPAKVFVIDVRSAENFAKGSITDTNWPLFDANGVTNGADGLAEAFTINAGNNKTALAEKEIYILCNSGARGAENAIKLLKAAGYDESKLHTITKGAKGLEVKYGILNKDGALDAMVVSPSQAEKDLADGTAFVIDVRNEANNKKASLKDSLHIPVFSDAGVVQTNEDDLAKAFIQTVTEKKDTLATKPIYILCNSGQSGARAATVLLNETGLTDVYTITGGAKAIENLEFRYGMLGTNNTVSGADAVASIGNGKVVVLDVRNDAKYNEGYLEGSLHIPAFTEPNNEGKFSPVGTNDDDLAKAFIEATKGNEALKDKDIYILCNSGARGARAATVLLTDAGYSVDRIYTITGGAGDKDIQAAFTTYRFVDGAAAVKADPAKTFIIDVRTPENFAKGTLANAVNWPLFDANGVTNGTDALAQAFKQSATDNADKLAGKDIYILCNSGARGAQNATALLKELGYNTNASDGVVYTIKYGATGIAVRYSFIDASKLSAVTGKETVEAVGNEKILILDVRAAGNYGAGHLKGAVSLPVFTSAGPVNSTKDALAVAFTDYVKANLETLKAYEHIYIVCNSGARGAQAATVLLNDAGVDLAKVSTVTGGAKGTTEDMSVPGASTYASAEYVLSTLNKEGNLVIDVRSAKNYAAGHLKDSLSLPVFDNDNKLDTDAAKALAEKFLAYAKANKADLDGKTIYILCNSGARGAAKAIELLKEAGVDAKVLTIENGAKSIVKDYFVASKPSSPQTGDSKAVMLYAFAMVAAVIVIARRREFTK